MDALDNARFDWPRLFMIRSDFNKRTVACPWIAMMTVCLTMSGFSQSRIEGEVTRNDGAPVPFANILLINSSDSTLAKGVITNAEGKFIMDDIKPGKFYIVGTMVGYKKTTLDPFEIAEQKYINMRPLVLVEQTVQLDAVTIEAEKAMFEQAVDRLVINVQNSITSAGNTVLEVLQKSPGIVVNRQDNSILMYGKSGVRIMVNGKMMQLPTDAAVQLLDGMSAANVQRIELIATPPARFDAEGNSGIIHIVMRENADRGTSGSAGATLGYKWAEVFGSNFNLQHRSEKAAYFVDYSFIRERNRHILNMDRETAFEGFTQEVTDSSSRKMTITTQNLRAGAEISITQRSTLSFLLTGSRRNWDMDAKTFDFNRAARDSTVITEMDIHEINIWESASAGLKWQTRPDEKREVTVDLDYIYYNTDNPSTYDNNIYYPEASTRTMEKLDVTKRTPTRFLVGKLDYVYHSSPNLTFETGLKAVASALDNNVLVQRFKNDSWQIDPLFTSDATLKENTGAAYLSAKWQNEKGMSVSAGIRYEHTSTQISTPAEGRIIDRDYGKFFPSIFFKKDFDKEKDVSLSYSRRITRPTFKDIAPFVFFWGPNTFSSGNTALWPSISDAVRAGYHSGPWIFILQHTHSSNEISFFQPEIDSAGNLIYRSQNLRYLNTLNVTNSVSFNVTRWWEVQMNVTFQNQTARTSHLENNASLTVYNVNLNVTNLLKLPKDFSIEISGFYQSKSVFGISEFMPLGSLNAGIQKKFGNKGALRFAFDDIMHTNYWDVKTNLSQTNLKSRLRYDWHNQFIRFTYTRNFGNKKLRSVEVQTGSEEERRRAN